MKKCNNSKSKKNKKTKEEEEKENSNDNTFLVYVYFMCVFLGASVAYKLVDLPAKVKVVPAKIKVWVHSSALAEILLLTSAAMR